MNALAFAWCEQNISSQRTDFTKSIIPEQIRAKHGQNPGVLCNHKIHSVILMEINIFMRIVVTTSIS